MYKQVALAQETRETVLLQQHSLPVAAVVAVDLEVAQLKQRVMEFKAAAAAAAVEV